VVKDKFAEELKSGDNLGLASKKWKLILFLSKELEDFNAVFHYDRSLDLLGKIDATNSHHKVEKTEIWKTLLEI